MHIALYVVGVCAHMCHVARHHDLTKYKPNKVRMAQLSARQPRKTRAQYAVNMCGTRKMVCRWASEWSIDQPNNT